MGLEITGMEGGIEGAEPPLQVQLEGHWSYALKDLKWAHPALVQFPGAWQMENPGVKQHHVVNLELLVAMVCIIVPFLVLLCLL